jgi:2-methylisocitrate lyase-like PEP mutase family enzyme
MAAPAKFLFDNDFAAPDRTREKAATAAEIAQKVAEAEARAYQDGGADAVLAVGMPDLTSLHRLRDTVTVPLIVLCVPGSPWFAPTPSEVRQVGADVVIYPATVVLHMAAGIAAGLDALRNGGTLPASGFGFPQLGAALRASDWAAIDRR